MKNATLTTLPISKINLDVDNPRIKHFLDIYKNEITAEQIALALSDSSSSDSSTTYKALRDSIKASRGIIHPIVVNHEPDGKYVVIEGNTRLQIYKDFLVYEPDGPWNEIVSLVYENLSPTEKHEIRLQSHLVGPREWDPYSKAKYLWELSEVEHLPMNMIISMCGGNKSAIEKAIEAYIYMEMEYRPYVATKPDLDYDTRNFSKFLEYQNGTIKNSIKQKGFAEDQFAKWVADNNVDKALKVRLIPQIMRNDEALAVFKKKNLTEAEKVLNAAALKKDDLSKYPYEVLARALYNKLLDFKVQEIISLAKDPAFGDKKYQLEMTEEQLSFIINEIKEKEE